MMAVLAIYRKLSNYRKLSKVPQAYRWSMHPNPQQQRALTLDRLLNAVKI